MELDAYKVSDDQRGSCLTASTGEQMHVSPEFADSAYIIHSWHVVQEPWVYAYGRRSPTANKEVAAALNLIPSAGRVLLQTPP
jgi:hypothetical protein